ncbi:MAG TPA: HAD family phosphatase [Bryobacteraceae bacterium]|nr:HAD family phosphatase [Bryobacteraceae bacterium]
MIQPAAVIFDYGKVLSISQQPSDMEAMARVAGIDVPVMHDLYWKYRLAFDRRDLSIEDYWKTIAREGGAVLRNGTMEEIIRLDNESWSRPNPVVVTWAGEIRRSGIRTAILSNMPITLRRYLTENALWLRDFEYATWSCDVNAVKPEPAIYWHTLNALKLQPGDTLFLDDKEENVAGAREVGMHAILFENPAQAWSELRGRFALPPLAAG